MIIQHWVNILTDSASLDGDELEYTEKGSDLVTSIYRKQINNYPKFFKMDALCKLGFVASELLLSKETQKLGPCEDRAIILFNRSSSLCNDKNYLQTIANRNNYYPSPSIFVYTLPNIITGEIAIRNQYFGETAFYVMDRLNVDTIQQIVSDSFQDTITTSALCGWIECEDKDHFEAHLFLVDKKETDHIFPWEKQVINKLIID